MATIDLEQMLTKVKNTQWALADVDWEAPGAELVTGNPELYAKLKPFMADLMWIEHVGARAFAAMAKVAPTDTLREMYSYFHAEEQRHANAEMALMKRWGMLDGDDDLPEPNINLRLVIEWLDTYADEMPFYVLGTVIPMLEIALGRGLLRDGVHRGRQAPEQAGDDDGLHGGPAPHPRHPHLFPAAQ
ncbi:MAG: ferritin-like protein [Moraxellaceae bacterium]|nr:ferritin-like protein [Moraxellaceae bacterium]